MDVKDRIRFIIESQRLNAGAFADRIGVQRSSVSHILSGRNKPGFEFLEKVLRAFPKVEAQWLITGKTANEVPNVNSNELTQKVSSGINEGLVLPAANQSTRTIVKIITFYDDSTFDIAYPATK